MRSTVTLTVAKSLVALCLLLPSVLVAAEPSVETNVVFGTYSGLALLMDVYKPAMSNGYGIIVIQGSAWHRDLGYDAAMLKQVREFPPAITKLVAEGYTAFVVNHRAAPRFHYQDAVDDAQRAVRFIRSDAARYGIRRTALEPLAARRAVTWSVCSPRSTVKVILKRRIRSNARVRRSNPWLPFTPPPT